jgi:aminobenzoyl-glutamate utilization protein B
MGVKATTAINYIDDRRDLIIGVADKIWGFAELALHEDKSAACLEEALKAEGFCVEAGVAGIPTAFAATWGSGRPVIGFLGEYDALGGLSQKPSPVRDPIVDGEPGHGCGHNLLGAGAFGGAIGLKRELEARSLPGTVKYFGCPAEENLSGKAFMAREGLFLDCDACLTWHAGQLNRVSTGSSLANNAANFTFYGRTAHAAGDPYNGRSALDAVQLMNLGAEFLREHMPTRARIHYTITRGGDMPNVVPAVASVWYLARAPERGEMDELWQRVLDCADGAAKMTGTTVGVELIKAIYNVLNNLTLEALLDESMRRVGPPVFGPEELEFAKKITESFVPGQKESLLAKSVLSPEDLKALQGQVLNETMVSLPTAEKPPEGSTDVGDVSWCTPTAQFTTACSAIGTPGHSWQHAAQAGMGIGHAGCIMAAKVLAEAGFELMTNPEALRKAKEEFNERTGGRKYKSPMPPDQKPAFHQFAKK